MHGMPAAGRRCVPSAGGLYPLELYVVSHAVDGRKPGLDHYDARAHGLTRLAAGDLFPRSAEAIFVPEALEGAAAVVVLSAVFGRCKVKYGERAYRFALIWAGHAMQNLCLAVGARATSAPARSAVSSTIASTT
jgi:SagB-type dehydrogenase family enzyme